MYGPDCLILCCFIVLVFGGIAGIIYVINVKEEGEMKEYVISLVFATDVNVGKSKTYKVQASSKDEAIELAKDKAREDLLPVFIGKEEEIHQEYPTEDMINGVVSDNANQYPYYKGDDIK